LINTQEKEIRQEEILIGEVKVPVIREDGELYYPISFITKKILLKQTSQNQLHKEYSKYIKKFKIDYGSNVLGGTQDVNCINEEGLRQIINISRVSRLSVEQRKGMNILLEYLHMETVSEDIKYDQFSKEISKEVINKYNEYIRDCIYNVLESDPNIIWQKCDKCNNYYPYHANFFDFSTDENNNYMLNTVCRDCKSWDHNRGKTFIKGKDSNLNLIYNTYGSTMYNIYKSHDTILIFNHWRKIGKINLPNILQNKEDKLIIIKYMHEKGDFKQYKELNHDSVKLVCGFGLTNIKIEEVYDYVLGMDYHEFKNIIISFNQAKIIIDKYLLDNNITINDVYNFNYYEIIRKCKLTGFIGRYCNNDLLEFIMEYYDNKYVPYKFKSGFQKYWTKQHNRINALKYFIEEDMKIELEKVPLYITLTALRNKGTSTLYTVCKNYYSSLFEWINEVYPRKFNPRDFDIHYIRNDFDSIEEATVHDILKEKFKHKVIYNPNNTDRTIKIEGKVPDWFVFGMDKCYIVEYFGLNLDRNTSHNSRIEDYKERTEGKIEIYNELDGYGKVFIFPDDLKDNFSGLMEKLELIH